ncbi:MAG: outer membrane beta-barrel protein [Bacteroidetes bacterium]|nr:outer membrane beta-barrel protein [Bacteroidota bacterium]
MKDKKNIDRLFMEKLKDFEATPSNSVWENISIELQSIEKGKKGIPTWWRVAGVAATLLLLFTISQVVLNNNTTIPLQEIIVDEGTIKDSENTDSQDAVNKENMLSDSDQKNVSEDLKSESSSFPSNDSTTNARSISAQNENRNVTVSNNTQNVNRNTYKTNKNELVKSSSEKSKNAIVDNTNSNLYKDKVENNNIDKAKIDELLKPVNNTSETKETYKTASTNTNVDENITESEESNTITENDKLSLTEEIAANEDENIEDIPKEEFDRWSIASNIAPVYFNSFGNGSSIHPQFNNNSKTGDINMSYGISGSYAINKKLRVRAGINKVNLGYSTNDVIVYDNIGGSDSPGLLRNVKFNEAGENLSFISVEEFNFLQVPGILNNFIESSIDQKLGFIEIPLELEYRISNKKMGISVIGGFSALFLTDNEIYSFFNGVSTLLGEATNINNTSFSANFGLGFDFKISDKFNLNLEPIFKYQINTFNETSGNFKPYFIGIYSGLSFKF